MVLKSWKNPRPILRYKIFLQIDINLRGAAERTKTGIVPGACGPLVALKASFLCDRNHVFFGGDPGFSAVLGFFFGICCFWNLGKKSSSLIWCWVEPTKKNVKWKGFFSRKETAEKKRWTSVFQVLLLMEEIRRTSWGKR